MPRRHGEVSEKRKGAEEMGRIRFIKMKALAMGVADSVCILIAKGCKVAGERQKLVDEPSGQTYAD
jgi:hypothetical protein